MTKVVFFGDPDVTSDAEAIYSAVDKEQNVDLYVNIGDNGYNGKGQEAVDIIKKHFPEGEKKNKLVISLGNHDDGESESDENEKLLGEYLPEQYATKPEFAGTDQSWQDTRWLTSRHVGDIYFICMNSQDMDIEFKRNQYNWVMKEVETAKKLRAEGKVTWIINAVHKPWFTLKSSHSPYTAVRELYSETFKNVVNQNWHGHNHNDQSWVSMIAIQQEGNAAGEPLQTLMPDGKTIDHSKEHGWATNVNGHSGHEHNKFKENATANKNVMWANDKTFSYGVVETNPQTKIANTKWKDASGAVLFEYNISMAGSTIEPPPPPPPPPPPTECLPGQCKDPVTKQCRAIGANEMLDAATGECKPKPIEPPPPPPPPTGTIVCPEHYHFDASLNFCIPDLESGIIEPRCPVGYKWNSLIKICEKDETTPPPPTGCPDGQCKDPQTQQCRSIGSNEQKNPSTGICEPKPTIICPDGQCKDTTTGLCRPIGANEEKDVNGFCKTKTTEPPPTGGGEVDSDGIIWFVAKGQKTVIPQSRDEPTDDRWSENIPGCEPGFEATFIGKSTGTNSSSHFAMKHGGSNHSKGDWQNERWYDTGVRVDGEVQLQWEGPHPSNHDFTLPDSKWFIKNIGKGLEGNWIGLKWCEVKLKGATGSPADGGVRLRMWCNTDIAADGTPDNTKWKLVYDFIDGVDAKVINPQDFVMKGTMDAEVRRSDTKTHEVYKGGFHVRPLGDATTTPPTENCPPGKHWDSGLGKCVDDIVTPPVCPPGQHLENGVCVPDVIVPPPTPTTGEVLWDSNVHLKTGQAYTIDGEHGDQKPNGKGVFMAASGSPHVIVDADGTFWLEADAGHGRMYIKALNFNSMMEGEINFPGDFNVVRNSTQRLRSRHQEGGSEGNNFGGFGQTIEVQEQLAEYETEPYHNVHENPIKKPLAKKIEMGKWVKFQYYCCNSTDNKTVNFKTMYDYGDGAGWVEVNKGSHPTPKPYYMDEALYMKESYAWLRMNNEAKGKVGFKNIRIIKLNSGDLG